MHANCSPSSSAEQFWVADTGVTAHMTSDLSQLSLATPFLGNETITHCGGFRFICDAFGFWIQDKLTGSVLLKGLCRAGLYSIPFFPSQPHPTPAASLIKQHFCFLGHPVNTSLWHKRFGHPSNIITTALLHHSQVPFSSDKVQSVCHHCLEGKLAKLPFHYPTVKSVKPLEVIHNDVWGPSPTISVEGFKYYVSFVDECTRFTWLFPMINKAEVYSISVYFHAYLVTQFSASLKVFQSDGGGEYLSHKFQHYLLARATQSPLLVDPDFQPESLRVVLPLQPVNLHPMTTRSKNGISKRKAFSASTSIDLSTIEPSSFKAASQSPEWQSAMREEIEALHAQGTWDLVPLPAHKNLVGCKWVYRIKKNADGSIASYKARLVAKGFSQEEGIDYYETFSPVVKPTTVRLVLALAAQFQWSLRQLDVKNAFLHGVLQEEVYMTQPQGFENKQYSSDFVCRLKKSFYGLKQAPRAWNERFTSFLPSLGFQASNADPSLFIHHSSLGTVVLLLYVDDIILTGSNSSLITSSAGLFVSQTKYVKELLSKVDLQDSKPCPTPCLPYHRLLKDDGKPYSHPEQYRSIVGALQYLTFTRPYIAFSVNQACQFMHNPMESHVVAVKRILRYLKGTIDFGIWFKPSLLHLQAYSDAGWAGDPNDRRSVSGFIVYLGSSPISWASKKQHIVSRSSTEAEYRALAIAAAELAWIRQLFCDMHVPLHVPSLIHCDNISAIALSSNRVSFPNETSTD
ncbi:hypothetical protein L3X38_005893 [Prunus dulcis]|uniref:Integrase catalytic domain-containing protein n=1 Tax=Prunus dulcis TaxID=3755 RepID=A0AAD4ZRW1_PRUDU|nr:hypothetical protein L3X38_005893 [Prunus dulcis]